MAREKIALYTFCYNEAFMLPFFMRHYRPIVDTLIVYDNESNDGSSRLAKRLGADVVRTYKTGNEIRDDVQRDMRNTCWHELKGKKYDWVMIPDVDEFLWHRKKPLRDHLMRCTVRGATICVPQGFQMVGDDLPKKGDNLLISISRGVPSLPYSKPIIFKPDAIEYMNFPCGTHGARPTGKVVLATSSDLCLLHYHWMSLKWASRRRQERGKRMSEINKTNEWGKEYLATQYEWRNSYYRLHKVAVDVVSYKEDSDTKALWAERRKGRIAAPHVNESNATNEE